jgi:asparagine synthase (glutamine-hydrolysing)
MCGIVGIVATRGAEPPDRERVERATSALVHRGPDDTSFLFEGPVAFGHTRLSIIDLERGGQPIANEDGSVLTIFNGEIWNHVVLRDELTAKGHVFRTRADTEVLVHGYEEWGEGLVERLDGMFAFAVWDARRERLLVARDRMGKKPLYFAETPAGFAFGSDARSVLVAGGIRPELERSHVAEFLFQRYVAAPRTLFRGVERLRPGHFAMYDRDRLVRRAYWQLSGSAPGAESPEEVRDLLRAAVRRRLMSDVPLGVLLSGGVDSSAVLGLMREAGADGVASFTIGFDDPIYDERPLARIAARAFGSDHHETVVSTDDFVTALPRLAWYRDEPIAEPSEIPLLRLADLAGSHVKVVLSGDGGDELFGGYPKYRAERLLRLGSWPAAAALRTAGVVAQRRPSHRRLGRAVASVAIRDPLLRWASWFRTFSPEELEPLLAQGLRAEAAPARLRGPLEDVLAPYARLDAGRRMLVGDLLTYLPDNMLLRGDKVLMAASLEGRMPLLDAALVERIVGMPPSARAGLRTAKSVLRRAVADLVPTEILRGSKRGFPVPVARFLLGQAGGALTSLLVSERALDRGLFERSEIEALLATNGRPALDRELKLFTLLALELWLRANVDEVRLRPPAALHDLLDEREAAVA